jgi:hypothetical protein
MQTHRTLPSRKAAMLGKMLWFNETRDVGCILTDANDRVSVLGSAFAGGAKPKGRCAQAQVVFEIREHAGESRAENVAFVQETSPRRARRRSASRPG